MSEKGDEDNLVNEEHELGAKTKVKVKCLNKRIIKDKI